MFDINTHRKPLHQELSESQRRTGNIGLLPKPNDINKNHELLTFKGLKASCSTTRTAISLVVMQGNIPEVNNTAEQESMAFLVSTEILKYIK